MERMKAYICDEFGPPEVLKLSEVNRPLPKEDEVLIKVCATSVNAADCNARGFSYIPKGLGLLAKMMMGFNKPKIPVLGSIVAGEIEMTGKNVTSFSPGDQVYGSSARFGGYGEYTCWSVDGALIKKPANISFEEAASIPYGALTALYFLRDKGEITKGKRVLVHGASGGVGVYAVQLARYFGAHVTGLCSTANVDFVKSLGADHVIDYTKEDFTQGDEKWDIIFDVVVGKTSFKRVKNALNNNGYYLAVAGGINDMMQMIRTSLTGGRKVVFGGGTASETRENMAFLSDLIERGELNPVLDKVFSFGQMVNAHRYVESGSKKGNIAVSVSS